MVFCSVGCVVWICWFGFILLGLHVGLFRVLMFVNSVVVFLFFLLF